MQTITVFVLFLFILIPRHIFLNGYMMIKKYLKINNKRRFKSKMLNLNIQNKYCFEKNNLI